jgi:hypothetical protein
MVLSALALHRAITHKNVCQTHISQSEHEIFRLSLQMQYRKYRASQIEHHQLTEVDFNAQTIQSKVLSSFPPSPSEL